MVVDVTAGANFTLPKGERITIWIALDNEDNRGQLTSFANVGVQDTPADMAGIAVASFVINDDSVHDLHVFGASTDTTVAGNNGWMSLKLL